MSSGQLPRKPSGSTQEAAFQRFVHEKLANETRLNQVDGHRVNNTTRGPVIIPARTSRRGGGASVTQFKLRFVEDDYLVCREWDGTTLGETDVYIAKPPLLKCSTASKEVYGATHSYTYAADTDEPYMAFGDGGTWSGEVADDYNVGEVLYQLRLNTVRTVDDGATTEDQRVVPPWIKGDTILANEFDGGETAVGLITDAGQSIEYVMAADSRMWAQITE